MAEFNILDYSNSRLITIQTGMARRQNGTFKVIHSIDLEQYRELVDDLESILVTNVTYGHPLRPFLAQQTFDIRRLLKRLSPNKIRRSIDVIGTAWKWIAGTPDSHDFEILTQKMGNLLENNNRQMIINELTFNKIQEISNITNEILSVRKEDWNSDLTVRLEHKLILIEKELQNIEYAIQWAKANIVNSFILSKTEIEILNNVLTNYNIPLFNVDELLTFGNVKIVTDSKEILYILSIPITQKDICKTYLAKPVKLGNLIDKIEFDKILSCNNELFAIKSNCKKYNDLTICNNKNIFELREDYCITNLFKNRIGNCTQVNNEHIPTVEEIGSDLILVNQYTGIIKVNNEVININGTYLIKYYNTTVLIDEREFFSIEVSGSKPLPASLQPKAFNTKTKEVLSLERIQKINMGNIQRLEALENKNNVLTAASTLILVGALCTIILISVKRWTNKKNQKTEIEKNSWESTKKTLETEVKENSSKQAEEAVEIGRKSEKKTSSIYDHHTF